MSCVQADSEPDNLLIEWMLIAELEIHGSLQFVLPVMIGRVLGDAQQGNGSFVSNLFEENIISKLPDIVCTKVVRRVAELLQMKGITPSSQLPMRTVKSVVQDIAAHLGVIASNIKISHASGSSAVSAAHEFVEWKSVLFAHVCSKLMECLERAEIVVGESRARQLEEEERRHKEEEERQKEEAERQKSQEQERLEAEAKRQLQEEKERKEREDKTRREEEAAAHQQREEELCLQEAAKVLAAAARREKEANLTKLLDEFGIQDKDASNLAAAGVRTVEDLMVTLPEDIAALDLSVIGKRKLEKLLEHVGAPAFVAASERKRLEEEAAFELKKKQSEAAAAAAEAAAVAEIQRKKVEEEAKAAAAAATVAEFKRKQAEEEAAAAEALRRKEESAAAGKAAAALAETQAKAEAEAKRKQEEEAAKLKAAAEAKVRTYIYIHICILLPLLKQR